MPKDDEPEPLYSIHEIAHKIRAYSKSGAPHTRFVVALIAYFGFGPDGNRSDVYECDIAKTLYSGEIIRTLEDWLNNRYLSVEVCVYDVRTKPRNIRKFRVYRTPLRSKK